VSRSAFRNIPSELKVVVDSAVDAPFASWFISNNQNQTGVPLNVMASGTDYSTRVGRQAMVKSISLRSIIFPTTNQTAINTTPTGVTTRFLIVCDKCPNGTAPTLNLVLDYPGPGPEADLLGYRNLTYRDRFEILYDKIVNIGACDMTLATAAGGGCRRTGMEWCEPTFHPETSWRITQEVHVQFD